MKSRKEEIEDFFIQYEKNFNDSLAGTTNEIESIMASSFAKCFIESSPAGVMCGQNDDSFVKSIQHGIQFYKDIGSKSMHITAQTITPLDDHHVMASIKWRYSYEKNGVNGYIDFEIHYFLRLDEGQFRIFAYITGDEQKALKDAGLIS